MEISLSLPLSLKTDLLLKWFLTVEHSNQENISSSTALYHITTVTMIRKDLCNACTMLILHLGYNGCLVPATQLHATCLTLLDLVYLLHEPIYESLLRASIENSTPSQLQG